MKNGTAAVFHSADGRVFEREHALVEAGGTREAGKVAGILLAYPGLNIEVGGCTDNAGGDQMNQTLSENRASSLRVYLVEQGVATSWGQHERFRQHVAVTSNKTGEWNFSCPAKPLGNPVNAAIGSLQ